MNYKTGLHQINSNFVFFSTLRSRSPRTPPGTWTAGRGCLTAKNKTTFRRSNPASFLLVRVKVVLRSFRPDEHGLKVSTKAK